MRFIVPELGGSNGGTVMDESHMPLIALIRQDDAPLQRQHAHLLPRLEAVVVAVVVGHGGREIPGGLIQPFVTFLGVACLAMLKVLLEFGP